MDFPGMKLDIDNHQFLNFFHRLVERLLYHGLTVFVVLPRVNCFYS